MSLTPARLDAFSGKSKKCGNSHIPAGRKCKKGGGMTERFLKKGGGAVETLGTIAGLTALATGHNSLSNAAFTAASLGAAAKGEGKRREGVRTKNVGLEARGKQTRNVGLTIAALSAGADLHQRHEIRKFKKKHPPGSSHNVVDLTAYRINRGR
jgi:hypothetical protein